MECLARRCASLWITNRTPQNLDALLDQLRPFASGIPVQSFAPDSPPKEMPPGTLVINATSAGLGPADPLPIDLGALPTPAAVFDMIYNPARTALLQRAQERGIPGANGLAMLVHQGAKSLEIWSGIPAMRTSPAMQIAARAALGA
jgi:shikimate dehydrogenase